MGHGWATDEGSSTGDAASSGPGGRWQRRAARRDTERRRIPKHGKAFVTLAQRMMAQRAAETSAGGSRSGRKRARRPKT